MPKTTDGDSYERMNGAPQQIVDHPQMHVLSRLRYGVHSLPCQVGEVAETSAWQEEVWRYTRNFRRPKPSWRGVELNEAYFRKL